MGIILLASNTGLPARQLVQHPQEEYFFNATVLHKVKKYQIKKNTRAAVK